MVATTNESRKIITSIVNNETVKSVAGYTYNTYEGAKNYLPSFVAGKVNDVEGLIISKVGDSEELVNTLDQTVDNAIDYVENQPALEVIANKTANLTDAAESLVETYLPADEDEEEETEEVTKPTEFVPRFKNLKTKLTRRTAKKISKGLEDLQLRTKEVVHVDLIAYAQSLDKDNYIGKVQDVAVETYENSKVAIEERVVVPVKTVYSEWMIDELSGKPSVQKFFSVVGETYDERVKPIVNEYKDTANAYVNENRAVLKQTLTERYAAVQTALFSVFHVLNAQYDEIIARKEVAQAKEYVLNYITLVSDKLKGLELSNNLNFDFATEKFTEVKSMVLEFYNKALADERLIGIKDKVLAAKDDLMKHEYVVKGIEMVEPYYNDAVTRFAPKTVKSD